MGIQVTILRADLIEAGCSLQDEESEHFVRDVRCTFPNGVDFIFDGGDETVWADFNEWGSNRPVLARLLEQFSVPHVAE